MEVLIECFLAACVGFFQSKEAFQDVTNCRANSYQTLELAVPSFAFGEALGA